MICEKCWADAYMRHLDTGKSQYACYLELLEERKDSPCHVEKPDGENWCPVCQEHMLTVEDNCIECGTRTRPIGE